MNIATAIKLANKKALQEDYKRIWYVFTDTDNSIQVCNDIDWDTFYLGLNDQRIIFAV